MVSGQLFWFEGFVHFKKCTNFLEIGFVLYSTVTQTTKWLSSSFALLAVVGLGSCHEKSCYIHEL